MNVEVIKLIGAIKYLHKYIHKGVDHAVCRQQFLVTDSHGKVTYDETLAFLHTRFMCAPEAVLHLFAFRVSIMSHTVSLLTIHMPGQQKMLFNPNDIAAVVERNIKTQLTEYFSLNSSIFETFSDAARQLGLLESNRLWTDTMIDAVNVRMPNELRQLFATICVYSGPSDPLALFEKFKDSMCEGFSRRGLSVGNATDLMLHDIQRMT